MAQKSMKKMLRNYSGMKKKKEIKSIKSKMKIKINNNLSSNFQKQNSCTFPAYKKRRLIVGDDDGSDSS